MMVASSTNSTLAAFSLSYLLVHKPHRKLTDVDGMVRIASILVHDVEVILLHKSLLLLFVCLDSSI